MPLTLTYADFGNGTGGTVTVAGAATGATVALRTSRFAGTVADTSFVASGSRVGNGTIALQMEVGGFVAIATATAGSSVDVSQPYFFRSSNGSLALHERILDAIRELVISMALPGLPTLPSLHVKAKIGAKLEQIIEQNPSCVYYLVDRETYRPIDNSYDSVTYPVRVVFNRRDEQTLYSGLSDLLKARMLLHSRLGKCPLAGVGEVHTVRINPGVVIDPSKWLLNYDASVLTFEAVAEQPAGLS